MPPQTALQFLRVSALSHFVGADHAMRLDGQVQLGHIELLTRDMGERHPITPRKTQHALPLAFGLHELLVLAERVDHLMRVVPGLLTRIDHALGCATRDDFPSLLTGLPNGVEPPVLDLQNQ